ncbi:transglutaminase-like domain-containing protein [Puniceibacterium sp. IMCC21224]|uniref:transglutaminase-like domain-containing protein n=1 Tax=Puniceibacterium sp. IMCC21224 TaxID=1618204 RepID=UPI00065D881E|nr:transglutaminase domain-containing protein [Puniceibacterium sp. IMCC21224]KMK68798.1 transglutaminase-like enzyme, predicted cysteine protease [Puniceibacterium sp. IMCC21224]
MALNRRTAMKLGGAAALLTAVPRLAAAAFAPRPDGWRQFEMRTSVQLQRAGAMAQAWVPVPAVTESDWSKAGDTRWTSNADQISLETDAHGARFVHAIWESGDDDALLDVTSLASTQNRRVDLSSPGTAPALSAEDRALLTAPTDLIPTDGIVRDTAEQIVAGAKSDVEKARRIYDWVVESTERNPETRGCGLGDIASMLTMGDLTGKCADLNTLYVGLARAAGLPARDVYGLRVAPSAFGYKSLGAGSSDITKAQHCRADVFLEGHGWVPVDPADVRKVVLEEPPKTLSLGDPEVQDVRDELFGAWEGNWVALNFAHDVDLPGSDADRLPFLMYPQAEIGGIRRDELDPASFVYSIAAQEV